MGAVLAVLGVAGFGASQAFAAVDGVLRPHGQRRRDPVHRAGRRGPGLPRLQRHGATTAPPAADLRLKSQDGTAALEAYVILPPAPSSRAPTAITRS